MPPPPPVRHRSGHERPLDVAIVGGLTVDRFSDGSTAPGGTVLHATRAAAAHGLRVGVLTIAGPEAAAQRGVDELRSLAAWDRCLPAPASITFAHDESGPERRLHLEEPGGAIDPADAGLGNLPIARRMLLGPVAGECDQLLHRAQWRGSGLRAAILQGWLRGRGTGEVTPVALDELDDEIGSELRGAHLLVASRQDLAREDGRDPVTQLVALRGHLDDGPILVVTDGEHGLSIGHPGEARPIHRPTPRVVTGVPTVGAGDMLAVLLLAWLPDVPTLGAMVRTADRAMEAVARLLEARRSS